MMIDAGVKARFVRGGSSSYLVDLLNEGLTDYILDGQTFDLAGVKSIGEDARHVATSPFTSYNYHGKGNFASMVDAVVLGATEVDVNFNANVVTHSDGMLLHGIGGWQNCLFSGCTILALPSFRDRIPVILDEVTTLTGPGELVDVIVTERGIAVNPRRTDLLAALEGIRSPDSPHRGHQGRGRDPGGRTSGEAGTGRRAGRRHQVGRRHRHRHGLEGTRTGGDGMIERPNSKAIDRKRRLALPEADLPIRAAAERARDFSEAYDDWDLATARAEAERCIQCPAAPCVKACPLGNDIPYALWLLEHDDIAGAASVFRSTSTMPEICGRVCPQSELCEGVCPYTKQGRLPVPIGRLEAFVTDRSPRPAPQVRDRHRTPRGGGGRRAGRVDRSRDPRPAGPRGHGVRRLARSGRGSPIRHSDVQDVARTGATADRLAGGESECASSRTRSSVATARSTICSTTDSRPSSWASGPVCSAASPVTARTCPESTRRPPSSSGPTSSAELRPTALRADVPIGRRVAVIGGGDTAMDCVRTALRLGAAEVTCWYRRTEEEMPGNPRDRALARQEGARFEWLAQPVRFRAGTDGRLAGMRVHPDGLSGTPIPPDGAEARSDRGLGVRGRRGHGHPGARLHGRQRLGGALSRICRTDEGHLIVIDPDTGATSREGVFAGGDAVLGPALVVTAVVPGPAGRRGDGRLPDGGRRDPRGVEFVMNSREAAGGDSLPLVLAINPGSTSTRLALYRGDMRIAEEEIEHPAGSPALAADLWSQVGPREEQVRRFLERAGDRARRSRGRGRTRGVASSARRRRVPGQRRHARGRAGGPAGTASVQPGVRPRGRHRPAGRRARLRRGSGVRGRERGAGGVLRSGGSATTHPVARAERTRVRPPARRRHGTTGAGDELRRGAHGGRRFGVSGTSRTHRGRQQRGQRGTVLAPAKRRTPGAGTAGPGLLRRARPGEHGRAHHPAWRTVFLPGYLGRPGGRAAYRRGRR